MFLWSFELPFKDEKMNWDQIERKWGEMTRRVEAPSSLSSTLQTKATQDDADLLEAMPPAVLSGSAEGLISGKPYE